MNYNEVRKPRKEIKIGNISIGGNNSIAVQSMTNTVAGDHISALNQSIALQKAGCDIVRITVPDEEAVNTIPYLKEHGVNIPIVADIHFDYRLALRCAEVGVDKIRINPGNIGSDDRVEAVCRECNARNIPIRIGVNSGSLEKHILAKYNSPTAEALCESAVYHMRLLEKFDFNNIAISIKSSDVKRMIDANIMLSDVCDYPIHLGVTEAGAGNAGLLKSSAGIGALLCQGIGDTLRISLTDDPVSEIKAAKELLTALNIEGQRGLNIISCPTCGRTSIDLISVYNEFSDRATRLGLDGIDATVAIMGCAVNGPGEASHADFGIAGGKGEALLFRHGEICGKIPEDKIIEVLIQELRNITK